MNAINSSDSVGAEGTRSPALTSLEREYRRVLNSEESIKLARAAARLQSAEGWKEPRASAVLAESVARWLGRDIVSVQAFYANGGPAVEVFALIGDQYLDFERLRNPEDMMAWSCERHRARFSQSKFAQFDRKNPGPRVVWGDPLSEKIAIRMAELLSEAVDQDVARLVLGA